MFEGTRSEKSGGTTTLQIRTHPPHQKYEPSYRVTAEWTDGTGKETKIETTVPFMGFFTADGYFVPSAFERWLRGQIVIIDGGKTASHSAAVDAEQMVDAAEDDDVIVVGKEDDLQNSTASIASGAETPSGKKRGRKKV